MSLNGVAGVFGTPLAPCVHKKTRFPYARLRIEMWPCLWNCLGADLQHARGLAALLGNPDIGMNDPEGCPNGLGGHSASLTQAGAFFWLTSRRRMCVSMQSEKGMQRERRAVETIRLGDRNCYSYFV